MRLAIVDMAFFSRCKEVIQVDKSINCHGQANERASFLFFSKNGLQSRFSIEVGGYDFFVDGLRSRKRQPKPTRPRSKSIDELERMRQALGGCLAFVFFVVVGDLIDRFGLFLLAKGCCRVFFCPSIYCDVYESFRMTSQEAVVDCTLWLR